ncbi:MAG: nuclear transport factor 2 family protein [Novosphingobium sp.]
MTIEVLLDREAIRDCLARLARGEDRRNADAISASFWPDARTDYGVFEGSFDEYLAWVVPGADAITNTQHVLGQSVIEIAGDEAWVETQVISYHRVDMGEGERDTCIGGRYLDRFARRNGEWRIVQRTMLYDWFEDWGQAIDWSQGVMGLPFSAEHFSGRVRNDYSERFFGRLARQ